MSGLDRQSRICRAKRKECVDVDGQLFTRRVAPAVFTAYDAAGGSGSVCPRRIANLIMLAGTVRIKDGNYSLGSVDPRLLA